MSWSRWADEENRYDAESPNNFRRSPGGDVPVYEANGGINISGPGGLIALHQNRPSSRNGVAEWFRLTSVDGIWDLPGVRQQRTANSDTHGTTPGAMSFDERTIAFQGVVHAGSLRGLRAMERKLKSTLAPRRSYSTSSPNGDQCRILLDVNGAEHGDLQYPADANHNLLQNGTARSASLTGISGDGPAPTALAAGVYYGTSAQQQTVFGSRTQTSIYYDVDPSLLRSFDINVPFAGGAWVRVSALGGATTTNLKLFVEFYDSTGSVINQFAAGRYGTAVKTNPAAGTWVYLADVWDPPDGAVSMKLRVQHSVTGASSTATWQVSDAALYELPVKFEGATRDLPYQVGNAFVHSLGFFGNLDGTDFYDVGPLPHNMINNPRGIGLAQDVAPTGWSPSTGSLLTNLGPNDSPPVEYFEDVANPRVWRVTSDGVNGFLSFGNSQPVTPGKRYYASVWIKPRTGNTDLRFSVRARTPDSTSPIDVTGPTVGCYKDQWTKVEALITIPADRSQAILSINHVSAGSAVECLMTQPVWAAAEEPVPFCDDQMHGFESKTPIRVPTTTVAGSVKRMNGGYQIWADVADIKLAQSHDGGKPGNYELPFMITMKASDPRIYEWNARKAVFSFPTIPAAVTLRPVYGYSSGSSFGVAPTGTVNPNYRMLDAAPGIAPGGSTQPMPGWVSGQYMDYVFGHGQVGPVEAWGAKVHTDGSVLSKPPYFFARREAGIDFVPVNSVSATDMMTMAGFATMGSSYLNAGAYDPVRAGDHFGVIVKQVASGERLCAGVMYSYDADPATGGGEGAVTKPHICVWQVYPNAATTGGWKAWIYSKGIQLSGTEWTTPGNWEYWIRSGIYDSANWPLGASDWNDRGWTGFTFLFVDICQGRPSTDITDTSQVIARDFMTMPNKSGDSATGGFGTSVAGTRGFCMASQQTASPFGLVAWEEHLITTPAPQSMTLDVPGDVETRPSINFVGPLKDPRLTFNGKPIGLKGTIPNGSTASIDLNTGFFYNGSGGATLDPTSRSAEIPPGKATITGEATGTTSGTSKIEINYKPAWI